MTLLVLTCKIVGTTSWFHSKASLWVWYGCVANGNAVNRSKMYARSSRTSWNQRAVLFKQEPMQEVLLLISGMSYMRNTTPRISSENRHHEHQKNIKAKKNNKKSILVSVLHVWICSPFRMTSRTRSAETPKSYVAVRLGWSPIQTTYKCLGSTNKSSIQKKLASHSGLLRRNAILD